MNLRKIIRGHFERNVPRFNKRKRFLSKRCIKRYSSAPFSQPHFSTHPHLLNDTNLTVGFKKEEFSKRRERLLSMIPVDSVALFPSAKVQHMSNDIPYKYRQDVDLYYLSGMVEPRSALVLEKGNNYSKYILFLRPRDPYQEVWNGARCGVERAKDFYGCDEAYNIDELPRYLLNSKFQNVVFNSLNEMDDIFVSINDIIKSKKVASPKNAIHMLRSVKSPAEVKMMKTACDITAVAFIEAMRSIKTLKYEWELDALVEYHCRKQGAQRLAYPPVVASGIRNTTLHYIDNDYMLTPGDLTLVDAGADFYSYTADITRTFPINGKFSDAQLEVYENLLDVQKKSINYLNSSKMNFSDLSSYSQDLMNKAISKIGLPTNNIERFYMHSIGHQVGMDTHDVSNVGKHVRFVPGNVVTIEPGIYIPNDDDIPERLRGIGIRIEDDVLYTGSIPIVLSDRTPKEVKDIEKPFKQLNKYSIILS